MGDEVQSPDWKKTERCSARQIKVLSAEKKQKSGGEQRRRYLKCKNNTASRHCVQ